MSSPIVSVIIPTYNRASVLPRAVRSVQIQNFTDLEIIICDDASTDKTVHAAESLSAADPRIRISQLPNNQGAAAARNGAMQVAVGKYLAFLDSDDEWLPGKLNRQISAMENVGPEVGLCLAGAKIIKDASRVGYDIPKVDWESDPLTALVTGKMSFTTSTIVFRRECLDKVGPMSHELRRGQDDDFLTRIFMYYGLLTIQNVLVHMHLKTFGKNLFPSTLFRADYMLTSYESTIRELRGTTVAKKFKARLLRHVVELALREHHYLYAFKYMGRTLRATPILSGRDWIAISKAFLHGCYHHKNYRSST